MAHVWTESMERKAICIRAWGENTSIDPSDTPENMGKFLQTLQLALNGMESGKDEATVTLSPGPLNDAGEDGLQLVATCPLPGFEPLKWPFYLKKSSSVTLTNDFAIPLVENLYSKSRQVDMLIQALKHKDHVIAKLSDKLEATGTGLEHVFTALSGRKKVTREAADGKIRGLAPFNERKMHDDLQNDADQPCDVIDLVSRVFGGRAALSDMSMNFASGSQEGWWRGFSSTSSLPHRAAPATEAQAVAPADTAVPSSPPDANDMTMREEDDDDGDDEFQVQSTPPRLKPKKGEARSNDATLSNQESPSRAVKEWHKSSQEPKRIGRIGASGGKKQVPLPSPPPKAASPPPSRPVTKAAAEGGDDDETASETASDVDETASLPDESTAPFPPPPAKASPAKKSGLGRIGGKAKTSLHDNAKTAAHADDTPPAAAAAAEGEKAKGEAGSVVTGPQKRLGVIGKRIGGTKGGDDDVQRGRTAARGASAAEAGTQRKQETSQERADRKREELKRELEKKAAAGPAKKKRRF
ncbi:XLF family protein [Cordyceps fumosorosea ARSEF 2679]|uniref:Non-homologous end-joining factor 1 n=1 Tax=Cordyceps fumosorosea (strain ARSEF 2679) TaxID=1081104 RepID=A0A167V2N0_CORFA|nr:XLF family protein [Cordyceps fumosorosea ARSEF 2679]OAA62165.1 XLF family protein [Cordyceps fumosorosea ARSEF 2679]